MKQEPVKRIVSKKKYVATLGKMTLLSIYGFGVIVAGLFTILFMCLCIGEYRYNEELAYREHDHQFVAIGAVISGICMVLFMIHAIRVLCGVTRFDPGIPLTRANTGGLPAIDSLVRASAEPIQAQETVLLRAATETTERQEEQLLRALAAGQE